MCDNNSITLSCPCKYDGIEGALQAGSLCDDVVQIGNPAVETPQNPLIEALIDEHPQHVSADDLFDRIDALVAKLSAKRGRI